MKDRGKIGGAGLDGGSGDRPDDQLTPTRAARWAEIAGEMVLAAEVLPGPTAIPNLEDLRARHRNRKLRRRATLAVASLTAASAFGGIAMTVLSHRQGGLPLSYVVEGSSTVEADMIEAPLSPATPATTAIDPRDPARAGSRGSSNTRVRFTEGTAIALAPGARLRVPVRTAVGADLVLDRGQASFAVVHRPAAKWTVRVGPFTVDVTGTRFSVDWQATTKRLTLDLETGGVVVRGNAAGPGIAVHPGERLVASMTDGRVTVEPIPKQDTNAAATAPTDATTTGAATSRSTMMMPPEPASPMRPPTSMSISPSHRARHAAADLQLATTSPLRSAGRPNDLRSDLEPPPITAPSAPSLVMGGGGVFCAGDRASLGFEASELTVSVPQVYHLAFSNPRVDHTHSWCGAGSARLDLKFDESGKRNFMGRLPHQSGQLVVGLSRLMDFTDKTVSLHMYIDGPPDARVSAQLYVIHHGKWVNGPLIDHLVPRRWWTISHTFRAENPLSVGPPYPPGGTSLVTDCDRIALVVYSTGGPRTWEGAIYVDEVGWK